ncbi:hypothetical protein JVU11DRAFT_3130 [Chiua virens]|nr:hypothetical protein JVU11DRAFT_3130 [Chiua virens]
MRTNIERAIEGLITSNKDITLANTLPAYFQEAGFTEMSLDALTAFEHALDKYPRRPDASHAVFAKSVLGISAEYWSTKSAAFGDSSCNMCDKCACCLFNLKLDDPKMERENEYPRHLEAERLEAENALILKRSGKFVVTILMGDVSLKFILPRLVPTVKSKKKGRRVHGKRADVVSAGFACDPYAQSTSAVML